MVGPGGALRSSSQQLCPVPALCARLGTCPCTCAPAMLRLPRVPAGTGQEEEVGWGRVCARGLLHAHTPPRRCTASRRVRRHPLFLPLLRGPHLLLGRGGDNNWDGPLLLLVQQVGDGVDTAQPAPRCTQSSRVGVSQRSGPSQWLQVARRDGEPTGATEQPLHALQQGRALAVPQPHGDGALQWMVARQRSW